jgi:hypothetical protein
MVDQAAVQIPACSIVVSWVEGNAWATARCAGTGSVGAYSYTHVQVLGSRFSFVCSLALVQFRRSVVPQFRGSWFLDKIARRPSGASLP